MRRAERYAANNITVPLGKVIDLSTSGMRLHCSRKDAPALGSIERFVLSNGAQKLALKGQIVRAKRPLWPGASCDVGVQFLETTPGVRSALEQLGKYGFVQGGKHGTDFKSTAAGQVRAKVRRKPSTPPPPELQASLEVGDLYEMLGVSREASDEEIRAAYRVKARLSHPDASDDPDAEQVFADLAKAYKVLISPDLRERYDALLGERGADDDEDMAA